jgi:hypothetical protein
MKDEKTVLFILHPSSFILHPFESGGGVRGHLEGSIRFAAAADHSRRPKNILDVLAQSANQQASARFEQLLSQAQQRPKGDAGHIARVAKIDDDALNSRLFDGNSHLFAETVSDLLALDALLGNRQDKYALLHDSVQKRTNDGGHATLRIKEWETSLWTE